MKGSMIWSGLCALALTVGICTFNGSSRAQTTARNPQQPQEQTQQQQRTRTFTGQIVKIQNGQYALMIDASAHRGYFLDDQTAAKKFDGQNVKVTGVLEASTSTIHVTNITPA